ncbi:Endo-1,3(4)-beta-glucanase [Phytophthora palmivora]|uniref:glucan endo-1,3-beta-D-glucosidase n=1 Tax=Phytophthora palmivora TaxID=4796 RepID=A0A2P4YBB9_9STRA|nr:Endo-1,3(4)-beta-glucanase [Phytophthora palmivora]
MALWGKVTGHKAVENLGSLILRLNAHAIRTYFVLQSDRTNHPPAITRNHVTGIFFDNKVYYNTWFLDEVYAIHGIQMIPVFPINELARTSTFVEQGWNDILFAFIDQFAMISFCSVFSMPVSRAIHGDGLRAG